MDTPNIEVKEEGLVVKSPADLIKHLSVEIDAHTKVMFDWRARGAFYWLVGPFVVISSLIIVTKQPLTLSGLGGKEKAAAVLAGICFLGMSYLGGRMEAHLTDQCNIWRRAIFLLSTEGTERLKESDVVVGKQKVKLAYFISHLLLLVTFVCSMIVVSRSAASHPTDGTPPVPEASPTTTPSASRPQNP